MSFGMSGTNQKTSTTSPAASSLQRVAQQFMTETSTLRNSLIGQFERLLSGSAPSYSIPIIGRAMENSRKAGASTLSQTQDSLAQANLSGTPFAQAIEAQTRQGINSTTAGAGDNLLLQFLQMIPNFLLGQSTNTIQSLASAVPGNNTQRTSGHAADLGVDVGNMFSMGG